VLLITQEIEALVDLSVTVVIHSIALLLPLRAAEIFTAIPRQTVEIQVPRLATQEQTTPLLTTPLSPRWLTG